MVSEAFRRLEDAVAESQRLHDELVAEIAYKLGKEQLLVERALYRAGVTTNVRLTEGAHVVNEFLMYLREEEHPKAGAS